MKTLLLVRHAKSSWDNVGQDDRERPLNERGKKDAPEMGKRLKDRKVEIDLFVSSHAKRAFRTARAFAEAYDIKKGDIEIVEDLYHASSEAFTKVISSLPAKHDSVALFSHNPGITDFANSLTSVQVDNIPTGAVFAVSAEVDDWKNFKSAEKKFLFFDYPKNPIA
jgi:phosphohistidine phosphatase